MKEFRLAMGILALVLLVFVVSCINKDYQATETYSATEYKTEYKAESYTETEDVVTDTSGEDTLAPELQWSDDSLPRGAIVAIPGSFMYLGYELPKYATSRLEFTFYAPIDCVIDVYDVGQVGHITKCQVPQGSRGITRNPAFYEWLDRANSQLATAKHLSHKEGSGGGKGTFNFDATGVTEVAVIVASYQATGKALESWIELDVKMTWVDQVTETKTVTKERQVPYQIPYQVEKQREVTKTKKIPIWELIFGEG